MRCLGGGVDIGGQAHGILRDYLMNTGGLLAAEFEVTDSGSIKNRLACLPACTLYLHPQKLRRALFFHPQVLFFAFQLSSIVVLCCSLKFSPCCKFSRSF